MVVFKKKIKVAIVTNNLVIGGVQKLIVDQANLLDQNLFDIVIISLTQFPDQKNFYGLIPSNIKVYKLSFDGFFDFNQLICLNRILSKERPDIVKTSLFFSNTIIRILKIFHRFKVIAAEHNTEVRRPLSHRFINWLLASFTYTIVADSKTVAEFVSKTEHIARDKFTVIYNGVELDKIHEAKIAYGPQKAQIRLEIGIGLDEKIFLNIARLAEQKNHSLMIEGFSKYIHQGGSGRLVIIGDGKLRNKLEYQATELKVTSQVIFLGEREDIYKFYSVSDYFLLTSVREGFCISAMNGLAFGLPLISTRVAGVVEYLKDGENGYFTDDNSSALATILNKISNLQPDILARMKINAEETAKDFGVDKYIETYERLFSKCVLK